MVAETSIDVLGLDHVDLTVNDLARSIPFYEKVLGALGFRRVPHAIYVAWANAHLAIVLRPAEPGAGFSLPRAARPRAAHRVRCGVGVARFRDPVVRGPLRLLEPADAQAR